RSLFRKTSSLADGLPDRCSSSGASVCGITGAAAALCLKASVRSLFAQMTGLARRRLRRGSTGLVLGDCLAQGLLEGSGVDVAQLHTGYISDGRVSGEPLDQWSCDAGVNGRDEPDPARGEPRRQQWHRDAGASVQSQRVGHLVEHLPVCEYFGRPDLDLAGARLR